MFTNLEELKIVTENKEKIAWIGNVHQSMPNCASSDALGSWNETKAIVGG
jgi:hypothetical protein